MRADPPPSSISEKGVLKKSPVRLTPEQQLTLRTELRELLKAGDMVAARAKAEELTSSLWVKNGKITTDDQELRIWREYYHSALALMPNKPDQGAALGRRIVKIIEASLHKLPSQQEAAAEQLIGNLQEHVIGDGTAALAAYERAAAITPPSPDQKERMDHLKKRFERKS